MLLLLFETSDGRYAMETEQVVEIVPLLQAKRIPGAPPYVAGIINYRGTPVPVFDLCALAGGSPCRPYFSTRIILILYPLADDRVRLIGLIAEGVTDVVRCGEAEIRASGILLERPVEGQSAEAGQEEIVQLFNVTRMIPPDVVQGVY